MKYRKKTVTKTQTFGKERWKKEAEVDGCGREEQKEDEEKCRIAVG